MKLYLVHCGYYNKSVERGGSESHANFFVAAESFADAKKKAKALESFRKWKMHIDTVQRIDVVGGHRITLQFDQSLIGETSVVTANAWSRQNLEEKA